MLNCAAHMIIAIDNPKDVVHIGLEYLVSELSVSHADAGFATPQDKHYTPITEFRNQDSQAPSIIGLQLPNSHSAMQHVWQNSQPVTINSVSENENLLDLKSIFLNVGCKSMLLQRLQWNNELIGIACVDHTDKSHKWSNTEVNCMHIFCEKFLGPLAGLSNYWFNPKLHSMFSKPSESELIAIRLAAKGLSYKEIANQLNKSTRTIENQFRNARNRLNAKNQIELVKKCEHWL